MRINRTILALLAVLGVLAQPLAAFAADWTEFGGSPERKHAAFDPALKVPVGTGPDGSGWGWDLTALSRSQPLIIGNRLYHLAGDELRCYDLARFKSTLLNLSEVPCADQDAAGRPVWPVRGVNNGDNTDVSRSHPTYDPAQGVIFFGVGRPNGVGAVALPSDRTPARLARFTGAPGAPMGSVVSAPLIIGPDTIAVGDENGYVWVIRGLGQKARTGQGEVTAQYKHFGGVITSSFAPLPGGSGFIAASDAEGKVMAYNVNLGDLWRKPFFAPNLTTGTTPGIPASFAVASDGSIYFSEKRGTFISLDGRTGGWRWIRAYPGGWFINNSPALSADKVFFTIRGTGWDGSGGRGRVLAFNRNDGSLAWDADLPGRGNTAPLYWDRPGRDVPGLILVGTTDGQSVGLNAETGRPEPWFIATDGRPAAVAQETEVPYRSPVAWSNIQGVATEYTLANGVLAYGVNETDGGVLFAAVVLPGMNFRLSDPQVSLSGGWRRVLSYEFNSASDIGSTAAGISAWVTNGVLRVESVGGGCTYGVVWGPRPVTLQSASTVRVTVRYRGNFYSTYPAVYHHVNAGGQFVNQDMWLPPSNGSTDWRVESFEQTVPSSPTNQTTHGFGIGLGYVCRSGQWMEVDYLRVDSDDPSVAGNPSAQDTAGFTATYDEPVQGRDVFTTWAPRSTTLYWKWKGEPDSAYRPLAIASAPGATIPPGTQGRIALPPNTPVPVTFQAPDQGGTMVVKINHEETRPDWETTFGDNTVEIRIPPNANLRAHDARFEPAGGGRGYALGLKVSWAYNIPINLWRGWVGWPISIPC